MKQKFSIHSLSLKRKIWIAVSLITLLPLIVILHHLSGAKVTFTASAIAIFIVFLGWWIIFEVVSSIIKIYSNTKKTLRNIGEETPDIANEVQSLDSIINMLSLKMRGSLEQLKDFSKKTEELNQEVSKKVFVLSTIIQANELFSKETPPEDILQMLTQRLKEILDMRICFCALKEENGEKFNIISYAGLEVSKIEAALVKENKNLFKIKSAIVWDKENKAAQAANLAKELEIANIALCPITSKGQVVGFLAIANNSDNFIFKADDLNVLSLFSQNTSLIYEHKKLAIKVDELEIFDYLTGLYNDKFITRRLEEEINRAALYQRPCGFLLMKINDLENYQKEYGLIEVEKLLKKCAKIFKDTLRPIDIAARLAPNKLGAILIEKNKRQSLTVAEALKEKIENNFKGQLKLDFSVAENPVDGATSQELISFAESHLGIPRNETP